MLNPSKQKTATPAANGKPKAPLKAFLVLKGLSNSWKSSLMTTAMARTLQASAKALKEASEARDRMKEREISTGRRTRKIKTEGEIGWSLILVEEKTEERFCPMKTR